MANESLPNDRLKSVWQNQPSEGTLMSVDEIRTKAQEYQKKIRWRNLREYLGVAIALAGFGWFLWHAPSTDARVGHSLVMVGIIYIAFQLYQGGSARTVPADMGLMDSISFYRRELERQLHVYRRAWLWMLAIMPGIAVLMAGTTKAKPRVHFPGAPYGPPLVVLSGMFLLVLWVRKRNQRKAREIQRQLDQLSAAERQS